MSTEKIKVRVTSERTVNPRPPIVRRRAGFFAGRLINEIIPRGLLSQKPVRDRKPQKAKEVGDDHRPHGGHRESKGSKRLSAQMSLARMSRAKRNKMLARRCREAGVRTPMALALAK